MQDETQKVPSFKEGSSQPTPPVVPPDAMREAVARDDAREKRLADIVGRYVTDCSLVHRTLTEEDVWLLEGLAFGPIASEIARLTGERDEADRRAGAAERKLADDEDTRFKANQWKRKRKEERGYHDNVSFDRVWSETCAKADRAEAAEAETARLRAALEAAKPPVWVVSNNEQGAERRYRMWSGRAWVWTPSLGQAAHFARLVDAKQILPDGSPYDYADRIAPLSSQEQADV